MNDESKYKLKISLAGSGSCVMSIQEGKQHILDSIDESQISDKWSFELVEMTDEELAALPEFAGW